MVTPLGRSAARADGRAAGQQGHGLGRPAVIAQRCQQGVERLGDGAGQVGADPAGAAVGLADQVVPLGGKGPERIGPAGGGRVPRHDGVAEGDRARLWLYRPPPFWEAELPLTVQLAASVVDAGVVAPGRRRSVKAELPLMVQLVRLRSIPVVHAAAVREAELPLTVQLVRVVVPPLLYRPPPKSAELPLTTQSVSVVVPLVDSPPPPWRRSCR